MWIPIKFDDIYASLCCFMKQRIILFTKSRHALTKFHSVTFQIAYGVWFWNFSQDIMLLPLSRRKSIRWNLHNVPSFVSSLFLFLHFVRMACIRFYLVNIHLFCSFLFFFPNELFISFE